MTPDDEEFDLLLRNARNLTPEQHDRLIRKAMERARALRARALRDVLRRLTIWVRRLIGWFRRRAAVTRLQALDDRMLKDIGVSRGEIETVVCGHSHAQSQSRAPGQVPQSAPRRDIGKAA